MGTHWSWVCPIACLEVVARRNIPTTAGTRIWAVQLAASDSLIGKKINVIVAIIIPLNIITICPSKNWNQGRGYKTDPRNGCFCNCDGVIEPCTRTLHALVNMLGPVVLNRVTSFLLIFMPHNSILQKIPRIVSCWSIHGAWKCCRLLDTTKEDSFSDIS